MISPGISDDVAGPGTAVAVLADRGADELPGLLERAIRLAARDESPSAGLRSGLRDVVLAIGPDALPHLEALAANPTFGAWATATARELRSAR